MSTSPQPYSGPHGKPGRRSRGIPHTWHSAFCIAPATRRVPNSSTAMPMPSGSPVPDTVPSRVPISVPITGYCASAESSRSPRSSGWLFSVMSRVVTKISSSGNTARNP